MNMTEIFANTKSLAENDQSIPNADITAWVDMAIDRINAAIQCAIPKTKGQPLTYTPAFDTRYHEALVIFGVAKYRESDSAYNDAQYFMQQFDTMLMQMQRDMVKLPSTRTDYNIQQIVVSSSTQFSYNLTIPSGSYFDIINVYKNDVLMSSNEYTISNVSNTIIFKGVSLVVGDKITIEFENNSDLNAPPYSWWTF
jgi:hypothetical protein